MISRAVFISQVQVHRTPEQQNSLQRMFRRSRLSLAVLLFVDIFQLEITITLTQIPLYQRASICITVSSFVVHCLLSNHLLKIFVKQIRNRNDGATAGDTSANTTVKSKTSKQTHLTSYVPYLTHSARSRLSFFHGDFEGWNRTELIMLLFCYVNTGQVPQFLP